MNPVDPIPAPNPALLEWGRVEGGFARERVARRLGVKAERVMAWEQGERAPTMRQIENLARLLHRPLSLFFLPVPPALEPLAAEYRRLPGVEVGHESPELRLAIRQMLARRENALNLMGELGIDPLSFKQAARLSEAPETVAGRLRVALGVEVTQQAAFNDGWEAWNAWRSAAEDLGVLVFQFPKVELSEVRGLAFPRAPLPVVALNSKETVPEARAYTLIHELLHLMLFNADEESTALRDRRPEAEWGRIERFVEVAASHTLVPEDWLERELAGQSARPPQWTVAFVRSLARRFRITPSAVAARLRSSRRMSVRAYEEWRDEWDRYVSTLGPARSGPSSPAQKTLGRSGRPFAQLVLQALGANRITSVDAARYLDLRYHHFDELRERLVARRRGGDGDA